MRILLTLTLLAFAGLMSAQSNSYDERLLARYSESRIVELQQENPEILDYWTFYLDNKTEIGLIPTEKSESQLEVITLDPNNFNVLDLDISKFSVNGKVLAIEGTNKFLRVLSDNEFITSYNEFKSSSK